MLLLSHRSFRSNLLSVAALVCACAAGNAHAAILTYQAFLSGPAESPPNGSPGTGFTTVTYNNVAHTLRVEITFSGLSGNTTASHIHAPVLMPGGTAGVATTTPTFAGFPLGVLSGSYDNTLDLLSASSYNPSYVSANGGTPASAEAALTSAMAAGTSYLNIHSTTFGGGEIRGFLVLVPAPGAAALLGMGGLLAVRRRRSH